MERRSHTLTFGFPRMHKEVGERRDFLPPLIHAIAGLGCPVLVETGIGSGMGYVDEDYVRDAGVDVVDERTAYEQDVVVVLRAPVERFEYLRPGATLLSMLHFPTRPARVAHLERMSLRAISLDSIVDDEGQRMVVDGQGRRVERSRCRVRSTRADLEPDVSRGASARPRHGHGRRGHRQARGRGRHQVRRSPTQRGLRGPRGRWVSRSSRSAATSRRTPGICTSGSRQPTCS